MKSDSVWWRCQTVSYLIKLIRIMQKAFCQKRYFVRIAQRYNNYKNFNQNYNNLKILFPNYWFGSRMMRPASQKAFHQPDQLWSEQAHKSNKLKNKWDNQIVNLIGLIEKPARYSQVVRFVERLALSFTHHHWADRTHSAWQTQLSKSVLGPSFW